MKNLNYINQFKDYEIISLRWKIKFTQAIPTTRSLVLGSQQKYLGLQVS